MPKKKKTAPPKKIKTKDILPFGMTAGDIGRGLTLALAVRMIERFIPRVGGFKMGDYSSPDHTWYDDAFPDERMSDESFPEKVKEKVLTTPDGGVEVC